MESDALLFWLDYYYWVSLFQLLFARSWYCWTLSSSSCFSRDDAETRQLLSNLLYGLSVFSADLLLDLGQMLSKSKPQWSHCFEEPSTDVS